MGVLWVVLAAVMFGAGSLAQSAAMAQRHDRPLRTVLTHPLFLVGAVFEVLGAVAHLMALQSVSLAVAQCAISGSLVVTALGARVIFGTRLGRRGIAAVVVSAVGLVVLSAFTGETGALASSLGIELTIVAATAVVAAGATAALVLKVAHRGAALAVTSGLAFAGFSISVRFLDTSSVHALLSDPTVLAVAFTGGVGWVFWTLALRYAPVTAVTAIVVISEVVPPSLLGPLLGDEVKSGFLVVAPLVLAATAAAATVLARISAARPDEPAAAEPPRAAVDTGT